MKKQEQILDTEAKKVMTDWGLEGFKKSFHTLFGAIMESMNVYAKDDSKAFALFIAKNKWYKYESVDRWVSKQHGMPQDPHSLDELYLTFKRYNR